MQIMQIILFIFFIYVLNYYTSIVEFKKKNKITLAQALSSVSTATENGVGNAK